MKQTLSDIFAMDEFANSETRAPKVSEMVPNDHFRETDDDKRAYALYLRVLPSLTSPLQQRMAATMILDRESVTFSAYRMLGIDRKTFSEAKHAVQVAVQSAKDQLHQRHVIVYD